MAETLGWGKPESVWPSGSADVSNVDNPAPDLRHRASRIGRVVVLAVLIAVTLCSLSSWNWSDFEFQSRSPILLGKEPQDDSDVQISQNLIRTIFFSKANDKTAARDRLHKLFTSSKFSGLRIVPPDESTKLWDLPEIKRYQVAHSILCRTQVIALHGVHTTCDRTHRS